MGAVVIYLLVQLPKRGGDAEFFKATTALTLRFRSELPWWYLVLLISKLPVALTPIISDSPAVQAYYIVVVVLAYLMALQAFRPWYSYLFYYMDVACNGGK